MGDQWRPLRDTGAATGVAAETYERPLLLGNLWQEDHPGGLDRYLVTLLKSLQRLGIRARAVVLGPVIGVPGVVTGSSHLDALPIRLWRQRQAAHYAGINATVIDVHFALYAFWPVVFGRLKSLPLVAHFQGPWATEGISMGNPMAWRTSVKKVLEKAVYRRARLIVVLSGAFKRLLVQEYGIAPWHIEVIPPGVDLERFHRDDGATLADLGLPESRVLAVAARRLVPRMGLDVLIEAWADVVKSQPLAHLVVIGEGPERKKLEDRAAHLGMESNVWFLGRVDEETLVTCYQAADISVVPSKALEGFGLVVLESLACGTPVVASNVDGLSEALGPFSPTLLVPPEDASALASRLQGVLNGSVSVPSADRCRAYAESFSWEEATQRNLDVYRRAAKPRDDKLRIVYLDHCAQLSGGEIALARLLPALGVDAHVVLAERGPLVDMLMRDGVSVEVLPMGRGAIQLRRNHIGPSLRAAVAALQLSS